jgi:hypothetical protein
VRPGALATISRLPAQAQAQAVGWVAAATRVCPLAADDLEELTTPYRTLLTAIGGGVQLTDSGHVPPELVRTLCSGLDIPTHLVGDASSESEVRPLLVFRTLTQRAGLLHSSGGVLKPTAAAARCRHDPARLWTHVAGRLPTGRRDLEVDVGWWALLAVAGGVDRLSLYDVVYQQCVDAGWGRQAGRPIARSESRRLVSPTEAALLGARYSSDLTWPSWARAAAASVLLSPPDVSPDR